MRSSSRSSLPNMSSSVPQNLPLRATGPGAQGVALTPLQRTVDEAGYALRIRRRAE